MFGFFKRNPTDSKVLSSEEYQAEFRRLTRELHDKFAVEDTPYDELIDAMAAVEDEMNRNGGVNWNEGNYSEYLTIIKNRLLSHSQFASEQLASIERSVIEIEKCGQELEKDGESSRSIEQSITYLIARVVDWCRAHPPKSK